MILAAVLTAGLAVESEYAFGAASQPSQLSATADQAEGRGHNLSFLGTVGDVREGVNGAPNALPVGAAPSFTLDVHVDKILGGPELISAGHTVVFLIHSPALVFGAVEPGSFEDNPWRGKQYRFTLTARLAADQPRSHTNYEFSVLLASAKTATGP